MAELSKQQPFDAIEVSRRVLRLAQTGSLATLNADGHPFASLVSVAMAVSGEPVLLLSQLAVHTQNFGRDPRVSLLLVGPGGEGGDPLAGARLTVIGRIARDDDDKLKSRFLTRHPEARGYADFKDFGIYRLTAESAHLVAGFGHIVGLSATELLVTVEPALADAERGAVAHMNEDHLEAIHDYATRLLGRDDGPWRIAGLDPLGIDLICAGQAARLDFAAPVDSPASLRAALVSLAKQARELVA